MGKVRDRTEAKEIAMSGNLVMSRNEWLARNATYRGTVKQAAESGYFTVRKCAKIGEPVSNDEMSEADNFWEIEKALKICSAGAKEKMTRCPQCPYLEKGCLSALLSDATRYIEYLKSPRHDYNERKKAESQIPENRDLRPGDPPRSDLRNPEKQGKAVSHKNGKPVDEWLKEERERRARNGEKDCISLWDLL